MSTEVTFTLDEAVAEVLGLLTGLDLTYEAEYDRYRAITRQLNRALRANALEQEWGFYASETAIGRVQTGVSAVQLPSNLRPRIINDDAVRFKDDGVIMKWAYFLPRESLSKYEHQNGLWCAITRNVITFSRPFWESEKGLEIWVPVMREPRMFRLPESGEEVSTSIRRQTIDFDYPDVVVARAAYFHAQSDPVMQPRVQTLESNYKDVMYQLMERDSRNTDTPYSNQFRLGIENGIHSIDAEIIHPHSDF
jgi:hypothetical protein